jgi:hypothetical protein
MYAAGIDDGQLGAQIAALDERIRQAEVATIPTRTLKVERGRLRLQLAAAALADEAPLPGANAEYERAREALAALARHNALLSAARAQAQHDKVGRRRALIGYGLFGGLGLVSLALIACWLWG